MFTEYYSDVVFLRSATRSKSTINLLAYGLRINRPYSTFLALKKLLLPSRHFELCFGVFCRREHGASDEPAGGHDRPGPARTVRIGWSCHAHLPLRGQTYRTLHSHSLSISAITASVAVSNLTKGLLCLCWVLSVVTSAYPAFVPFQEFYKASLLK